MKVLNSKNPIVYILISVSFLTSTGCSSLRTGIRGEDIRSSYSEKLDFETPLTLTPKDQPLLLREKIDTAFLDLLPQDEEKWA